MKRAQVEIAGQESRLRVCVLGWDKAWMVGSMATRRRSTSRWSFTLVVDRGQSGAGSQGPQGEHTKIF